MAFTVFIDGAAGTTGLEIRERLAGRSEFELLVLDDASRKDEAKRKDALHAADIAILCLPDDAARDAVALAKGSDTKIIDASSAHRVADGWTYGFPEIVGAERIAEAQFVSNPGCYPTGFLALIAPLVRDGLLPADYPYCVNAVSGYSGGGKALIERFEQAPNIAFRTYGLTLDHKHLPEMQKHANIAHPPVFAPSVVPAHRGMLVDVPIQLSALQNAPSPSTMSDHLAKVSKDLGVISVAEFGEPIGEILLEQGAQSWDGLELRVAGSADGSQVRLIAKLDNLGKGASGAAIQNLNLMCGLEETAGLRL